MIADRDEWKIHFEKLKSLMKNPGRNLPQIVEFSVALHQFTHGSRTPGESVTLEDELWQRDGDFKKFSEKKLYSVAWHLWHSARVEDIVCSHFLCRDQEVLDQQEFAARMKVSCRNTGNSLNFSEMGEFNANIDLREMREYRNAVGNKTKKALERLTSEKLQEKVMPASLSEILEIGSVAKVDDWLLDYWGKKKISGIIMMPLTRHLLVHLNSAMRLL